MIWPFKRKLKSPSSGITYRSPILDRHFQLLEKMEKTYTPSSEMAVEKALKICHELIGISEQVNNAWIREYGNRGPGKTLGLPSHPGYRQLAIIHEKRGELAKAIEVAKKARSQGWSGDWQKRIARCESKIAKRRTLT